MTFSTIIQVHHVTKIFFLDDTILILRKFLKHYKLFYQSYEAPLCEGRNFDKFQIIGHFIFFFIIKIYLSGEKQLIMKVS